MATQDPIPETQDGNTVFILSNGEPSEWTAALAGNAADPWLFIARFRNVPDELMERIIETGESNPHWEELIAAVDDDDIDILR